MKNERIIVQLASPERKYVKVYHDFLDNSFLTTEEQMIFIVLKSYIDFKEDSGEAFPSIATLCKRSKMSKPRTTKAIKGLIKKGIAKKVQRGLTKTNLYTLSDYALMWTCDNVEDVAAVVENQGMKPLTPEEHIAALEKMGYAVEIKEKELVCEPTTAHTQAINKQNSSEEEHTTDEPKSQTERYSMDDIKALYDYDTLKLQYPAKQKDLDIVFDLLYDTLNSTKQTIRIGRDDKPQMVVIGKLMKLQPEDLIYAISKYHEQDRRIRNVKSYLLTILYNAKEQNYLDMMNEGHYYHDF